jgi:hypothetical protein
MSKINDETVFKEKSGKQKRTTVKRERKENTGVHAKKVKNSRY